jgi:putative endonuclease
MTSDQMAGFGGFNPQNINLWFVYILELANQKHYTGCTSNLDNRINQHINGLVFSTKDKLPIKLVTFIAFTDKNKAFKFEKYLKSGSGRAFKNRHLI